MRRINVNCKKCNGLRWGIRKNGYRYCIDCQNKRVRKWQGENFQHSLEYKNNYNKSIKAKEWWKNNKPTVRWYSYLNRDKAQNLSGTISKEDALKLMLEACFYCTESHSNGLDRIDTSKAHSLDNVKPCCRKCNNILGDLPFDAKVLLASGLKQIMMLGLLNNWEIPTMRK